MALQRSKELPPAGPGRKTQDGVHRIEAELVPVASVPHRRTWTRIANCPVLLRSLRSAPSYLVA